MGIIVIGGGDWRHSSSSSVGLGASSSSSLLGASSSSSGMGLELDELHEENDEEEGADEKELGQAGRPAGRQRVRGR